MTPKGREPGADFDRWLQQQLRSALDPELGPRPHPAYARYAAVSRKRGGRVIPVRFSISAALAAKAVAGAGAVALAASLAGAVTTHSANPATWGQRVSEFVETCKAPPDGNVGRCVSDFAQQHGTQVRDQHSEAVERANASPSPKPGQREGSENAQGQGNSRGNAQGNNSNAQGRNAPSPSPSPTGRGEGQGQDRASPHP
jgi:hypothetical protein